MFDIVNEWFIIHGEKMNKIDDPYYRKIFQMKRYRKKASSIEAWQVTLHAPYPDWLFDAIHKNNEARFVGNDLEIYTPYSLEGVLIARLGDYLITDESGNIFAYKPDIFDSMYEAIDE